tara:strand:+ start:60 stop:647 length:588 start_codon:yes stop_codon:yes gene_type:complete
MNDSENYIRQYTNILPNEVVDNLKLLIDGQGNHDLFYSRNQSDKKDLQFSLEPFYPNICKGIYECLIDQCLHPYLEEFSMLKRDSQWITGSTLIQKTKPSEGYHVWHDENSNYGDKERLLAWMIYLNDVEEGGETEFLYQQKRFKPKKNVALIWPGSWPWLHRGNPPISGDKYILTGWFTTARGMRIFNLGDTNE